MATAQKTQTNETLDHTMPPFLRRVRIRGYKSVSFCDVRLQPLTILVGRNAAGKSNFLDALAFLRDSMGAGVSEAVKRRGGWASIVSRATSTSSIEIEVEAVYFCGRPIQRIHNDENGHPISSPDAPPSDFTGHRLSALYSLQIVGRRNAPPVIRRETLELEDETMMQMGGFKVERDFESTFASNSEKRNGGRGLGEGAAVLTWKGENVWFSKALNEMFGGIAPQRSDICLLSVLGFQPFLELSESLRNMGFYNFYPDAIRSYQRANLGWLLEKDGHNLASVIQVLKEVEPEVITRVRDYLAQVDEEVTDFDVVSYGDSETVRFRLRGETETSGLEFDAANMSDGTLRALAILIAAFQIHLPMKISSVIGIEEPEAALHPAAMRALVDALDDATQRTQILLTTHSADLLSGRDITPGQVLIVRNRGGKTQITPLDKASQEIIRKELYTLADLQRMDKLDLDEADLKRQAQLSQTGGL